MLIAIILAIEKDTEKAEKMLKIVSMYLINVRDNDKIGSGLRIRTSFFNHSCHPNAIILNPDIEQNPYEIRAIDDIEPGMFSC